MYCTRVCRSSVASYFETLGKPRFISAPMVDQSDLAFRLLCKANGTDLAYTEMFHARNFAIDPRYRSDKIDWYDKSNRNHIFDNNIVVQMAGNDKDVLLKAASFIQHDPSVVGIDLNLGCPQNVAKKGKYGAYLLPDKNLVLGIVKHLSKNLDIPISVKIRMLTRTDVDLDLDLDGDEDKTVDLAYCLQEAGASLLTIHGRTIHNKNNNIKISNWNIIKKIKNNVKNIPIVGNGGISNYSDAIECMKYTGCDSVMASEALLENPKMFLQSNSNGNISGDDSFRDHYIRTQLDTSIEYMDLVKKFRGRAIGIGKGKVSDDLFMPAIRSHLFKFLHKILNAKRNHQYRLELGTTTNIDTINNILFQLVEQYQKNFPSYDSGPIDEEEAVARGLLTSTSWYMRRRCDISGVGVGVGMSTNSEKNEMRMRMRSDSSSQQLLKERLLAKREANKNENKNQVATAPVRVKM
jgi:tRNA-dihydrouridine synthase 4